MTQYFLFIFIFITLFIISNMPKKVNKKSAKKSSKKQGIKKNKQKSKLGAGKKECKNCRVIMPIHKKTCPDCGHSHQTRKNKEHIMKKINKMTPILVKSIIQNNDFNQFKPWTESTLFDIGELNRFKAEINDQRAEEKHDQKNIKAFVRKRSQQKSEVVDNSVIKKTFKPTNLGFFDYIKFQKPIGCLASSKDWLVISENIFKSPIGLEKKDQLTVQAYNLENFTLVGSPYIGETTIHFCFTPPSNTDPTTYRFDTFPVKKCIISMKIFSNLLGMLTGESSIIFLSLPQQKKNHAFKKYNLEKEVEIMEALPDRITCFQFLRSTAKTYKKGQSPESLERQEGSEIYVAVGTLYGRISIYRLASQGYSLVRFIPNAHMEMVTTISECPLNSTQQVMFASGSYDGNVSIWSLSEKSPIFSFECSNRKIWSIYWDPGCKFLFINRDEMSETCVIICFYSINKIETTVNISDTIETRTVKTNINATIVHHDYYSKFLPVLDPVNGIFKLLELEDLRGSSLKKKKPKKDEGADKYFKISPILFETLFDLAFSIEEILEGDEQFNQKLGGPKLLTGNTKKFPLFSGMTIQSKEDAQFVYFSAYNGGVLVYKHQLKQQ